MSIANFSLAGKVALVTGGSRGIGKAIALGFAEQGADVVVASRKIQDLEPVAAEIKALGRRGLAVASHVAKVEDSKNLIERIKSEFGRLDILANNAGTNPYSGPLLDTEEWAWDVTHNVNLKGPFLLSLMAARMMKEQGGGNIINISSAAGLRPSSLHIYSITKAGVVMMTRVMAQQFAQYNIRVNAICPGIVKTRLSEMLWKDNPNPEGLPQPEDIAGTAVWLASDASKHVTGEAILIAAGGAGGFV